MRRKLSNCAAKLRQIYTKSAVIVRHFELTLGLDNVVGRPDQTPEHQKQQKHRLAWPRVLKNQRLFVLFKHTLHSECHVICRLRIG